jgi:peptidoglycan hydrolase CwlO-like protein
MATKDEKATAITHDAQVRELTAKVRTLLNNLSALTGQKTMVEERIAKLDLDIAALNVELAAAELSAKTRVKLVLDDTKTSDQNALLLSADAQTREITSTVHKITAGIASYTEQRTTSNTRLTRLNTQIAATTVELTKYNTDTNARLSFLLSNV